MKKSIFYISMIFFLASITLMIGRSFRVSKVPYGSKYSCNTCHTNGGGTPRNPFGLDVESRVTPNGTEVFWGPELAALDSDGDGFTNGEELQDPDGLWSEGSPNPGDAALVTHPGNPDDFPTSVELVSHEPKKFELFNNYPNPFNPSTTIRFSVAEDSNVKIVIFDQVGQEVKVLVNNYFSAGTYQETWDAHENGSFLSSGIYYYTLKAGSLIKTKKMVLLK
jgi:hypothetical protein